MSSKFQVVFDAHDPMTQAEFWATALGYILQPPPDTYDSWEDWARAMEIPEERWNDASALVDPDGIGPRVFFQKVPERKTAKNRVHLDVSVGAGLEPKDRRSAVEAEAVRLQAAGANTVRRQEQRGEFWIVMEDPEGNEFCIQ